MPHSLSCTVILLLPFLLLAAQLNISASSRNQIFLPVFFKTIPLHSRGKLLSSWYVSRENLHVPNFRYTLQDGCFVPPISTKRVTSWAESKTVPFLNLSLSAHSQQLFTTSGNPGTSPRALKPALEATGYAESGSVPFHRLSPFMSAPWAFIYTFRVGWQVQKIFTSWTSCFSECSVSQWGGFQALSPVSLEEIFLSNKKQFLRLIH